MEQLHLMKWTTALVILMGAGCPFALAQSKDSPSKDSLQLIAKLQGPDTLDAFAFSPDGRILAASYPWHAVILWDVAKGERRADLDERRFADTGNLVFTPDGKRLAMTSGAEHLRIWDIPEGKKTVDIEDKSGDEGLGWVAFSRDGKLMATGSFRFGSWNRTVIRALGDKMTHANMNLLNPLERLKGIVTLREPKDGKVQKRVKVHDGPVNAGDFSPDGKTLALATGDSLMGRKLMLENNPSIHGRLKLLDIEKGEIVKSLTAHADETKALKFSPDGRILATGGGDGAVKFLDVATWKEQCNLKGHESGITSLAFSPDGKLLASADQYSVKLWDVANQRELAELSKQLKGGNSVAFAPQGCLLATGVESDKDLLFNCDPAKQGPDYGVIRLWKVQISNVEKLPK